MGKLRLSLFSFTRADLGFSLYNFLSASLLNTQFEYNLILLEVFCFAKASSKGIGLELKAPAGMGNIQKDIAQDTTASCQVKSINFCYLRTDMRKPTRAEYGAVMY